MRVVFFLVLCTLYSMWLHKILFSFQLNIAGHVVCRIQAANKLVVGSRLFLGELVDKINSKWIFYNKA